MAAQRARGAGEGQGEGAKRHGAALRRARPGVALAALVLLLIAPAAQAQDLTLVLDPIAQGGQTGQTVTFVGLLENTLGTTVQFDGIGVNLSGFDPTDVSFLFDLADIANGNFRTTDLFSVYISPSVATGTYWGTVFLDYSHDGGAGTLEHNFRVDVENVVPEPAFVQLPALLGLGAWAWWRRRR